MAVGWGDDGLFVRGKGPFQGEKEVLFHGIPRQTEKTAHN